MLHIPICRLCILPAAYVSGEIPSSLEALYSWNSRHRHGWFHSHPGTGPHATAPSSTDMATSGKRVITWRWVRFSRGICHTVLLARTAAEHRSVWKAVERLDENLMSH